MDNQVPIFVSWIYPTILKDNEMHMISIDKVHGSYGLEIVK